ncbi:MAG: hypothetical protein H0X28_01815 [Solirubrobacterales bacterium]|nr:hypothetical protein [Solirubrobacterales bacterium]
MSKPMFLGVIVAGVLVGGVLAGCGGASGSSDVVVAKVGNTPITESTLNHWTATFVRGDFYSANSSKAPAGLATDPPDYAVCVKASKTLEPISSSGKPTRSAAQLEHRCQVLYKLVRAEALSYLISSLWAVGMSAEIGKHVSDQDVQRYLGGYIKREYRTQQAFATYLANRGWSIADMHYILKRNLLSQQLDPALRHRAAALGGGERAYGEAYIASISKWTLKTHCRAGDVVARCKGYKAKPAKTGPGEASPAVILEEIATGR